MNILIFGPNGSGKGTQGAVVQKRYGVPHIETGVIFRENINYYIQLLFLLFCFFNQQQ